MECPICYQKINKQNTILKKCTQCKKEICEECFTKIRRSPSLSDCCPMCREPYRRKSIYELEPSDPDFDMISSFNFSARLVLSFGFIYRLFMQFER